MLAIIPDYEGSSSDEDEATSPPHMHGTGPSSLERGHQRVKRSSDHITLDNCECSYQEDDDQYSDVSSITPHLNSLHENLIKTSDGSLEETETQESLQARTFLSVSKSAEKCVKSLPESKNEASCSFKTASSSGGSSKSSSIKLSSEQEIAIRYLALKRRRDEEMRQLETVKDPPNFKRRRRNRKKNKGKSCEHLGDSLSDSTSEMQKLTTYIGVNDHLRGSQVDHGHLAPKCGLEKQIDQAISEGDMSKAEELSDYLATRNFAVRVAEAANARDYDKIKQEEEKEKLAKKRLKKNKLAWGFEVKHRWEMKGNM